MSSSIYESQDIINSFHAVDVSTGNVIPCSDDGFISITSGTTIRFENPNAVAFISANTLVIKAGSTPVKLQINDNEKYPFFVAAGESKGIQYMRIYKIKALQDCTFYYEGLTA